MYVSLVMVFESVIGSEDSDTFLIGFNLAKLSVAL